MSWQVPQYLIITCGEVLFSITGADTVTLTLMLTLMLTLTLTSTSP